MNPDLKTYELKPKMCANCKGIIIFSTEAKEVNDKNEFGDKLCERCLFTIRITAKDFPKIN